MITIKEIRQTHGATLYELSRRGWDMWGSPKEKGGASILNFVHAGTGEDIEIAELELEIWLDQLSSGEERRAAIKANPENFVHKTYRLQYINCGKERCKKCESEPGHGPYWYCYYRIDGKLKSKYIGKKLPAQTSAQELDLTDSLVRAWATETGLTNS